MLECIVEPTGSDYDLLLTEQLALTRVLLLNRQSRSTINGLTVKNTQGPNSHVRYRFGSFSIDEGD